MIPTPENFHSELLQLAQLTQDLAVRWEERRIATKARFNVFRVLYPPHYEVQLHSRFMSYMLDATAEHDCGRLFLDLFIETLEEEEVLTQAGEPARSGSFAYLTEKTFFHAVPEADGGSGRRIDILLSFQGQVLAIENKIQAWEQPWQIRDYSQHLKSLGFSQPIIVYLTLTGDASETSGGEPYFRISYEKHILRWMEKCLQATYQFVGINQSLQQYRDVIIGLLGKGLANEKDEMTKTTDFISNHPSILRNGATIMASLEEARKQGIRDFFRDLINALKERNQGLSAEQISEGDIAEGNYGHISLNGVVDVLATSPLSILIEYGNTGRGELYLGIVHLGSSPVPEVQKDCFPLLKAELNKQGMMFESSNEWWPIGWHFLSREFFSFEHAASMLDRHHRDTEIVRMVDEISKFFDALQKAWQKTMVLPDQVELHR